MKILGTLLEMQNQTRNIKVSHSDKRLNELKSFHVMLHVEGTQSAKVRVVRFPIQQIVHIVTSLASSQIICIIIPY